MLTIGKTNFGPLVEIEKSKAKQGTTAMPPILKTAAERYRVAKEAVDEIPPSEDRRPHARAKRSNLQHAAAALRAACETKPAKARFAAYYTQRVPKKVKHVVEQLLRHANPPPQERPGENSRDSFVLLRPRMPSRVSDKTMERLLEGFGENEDKYRRPLAAALGLLGELEMNIETSMEGLTLHYILHDNRPMFQPGSRALQLLLPDWKRQTR